MPTIDLDFGSVDKVPEGWFRLTCDQAILKPNKSKDGYIINLQMHFTDMPAGNLPGTEVPYEQFEGSMVYDNPSMKPSARWKLKGILQAFTGEDWDQDGMELEVSCVEECDTFKEEGKCKHNKHVLLFEDTTVAALIYSEEYEKRTLARVEKYVYDDGQIEFGASDSYTE